MSAAKLTKLLGPSQQWSSSSRSEAVAVAVALFYGTCSISMNFLNKAVVSSYQFNYPFFIMAVQMILTLVILDILRLLNFLSISPYSLKDGCDFMPASLCFALHSTLSLYALHGMNIPMYGAIKRCTPLVNLVLSVLILKHNHPSVLLSSSVGLITVGCFIAGLGDLEFDAYAYFMGSLSVFAQAGYLTLVQKSSEQKQRNTVQMVHVNSFNTLPIFLIVSMLVGEPGQISQSSVTEERGFLSVFFILVFSGGLLTFSQFLCASVCSALTTSMVSVGKSVLQTIIGFFTFGGVQFHPLNITGLSLNVLGGITYTYVKHKEKKYDASKRSEECVAEKGGLEQNGYRKINPSQSIVIYEENEKYRTV